MKRRIEALLAVACLLVATAGPAAAQFEQLAPEPAAVLRTPQQREAASLPLRTALHSDPTLAAPLERLLRMYQEAGAVDELLQMYRAHVSRYPDNLSGQTVLVRLLVLSGNPEAPARAREAVGRFPKDGYLRHLLYGVLHQRHERDALAELDKAIELETDLGRKTAWVDELLAVAASEGRPDLAEKNLVALAALTTTPEARLEVARKMIRHRFFAPALALAEKQGEPAPSPETMVSLELEAATAEVGLDRAEAAAARLDRLLGRLTADYWRRGEIVARRLALVRSQDERDAMVAAARKRVADRPRDESAALDLAETLCGFQLRREALGVLLAAGRRLPASAEIEKRTLDLFDRLRDEHAREQYLAERIKARPDRDDLVLMRIKTLYLLGRSEEARAGLDALIADAAPADRVATQLAVARFLRRCTLPGEAAELFARVVKAEPSRLDVRRELAETYLATGARQQVRELFTDAIPADADQDKLLDLLQFMIQQELFVEARRALVDRVAREKTSLELRMLLLTVHRRLGSQAEGRELIEQSRGLADTVARYRMWLEAAVAFHEDFETSGAFLAGEQGKLDEESAAWAGNALQRRLILAEVAARSGRRSEMIAMLRQGLEAEMPAEDRVEIRRRLVELLESDRVSTPSGMQPNPDIRQQLEALAREAPESADACRARLALLEAAMGREERVAPLLAQIDVTKIQDAALLARLKNLYLRYVGMSYAGGPSPVLTILERLTVLNPADRSAWEQWLGALAGGGDEEQLCHVLRRLLAGVDKMPLSDETRELLNRHLADSQWRQIAIRLAESNPAGLADTLPLVDSVQRMAADDQQWLWVAWTRAYVLHRLGREKARDEAIAELDRMAARLHDPANDGPPRILLPDGLTISLQRARELISSDGGSSAVAAGPSDRRGPLPPLVTKWAFETGRSAPLTAILPVGTERVLTFDATGAAHCLDATGGKLLWQRDSVLSPVAALPASYNSSYSYPSYPPSYNGNPSQQRQLPEPLADDQGRFYVPGVGEVTCYSVEDGRLLWQAEVGAVGGVVPQVNMQPGQPQSLFGAFASVFVYRQWVLTYDPQSGTVTRIDPATGKIVWDRVYAGSDGGASAGLAQDFGASLSGDRLMIYGPQTAILQLPEGEIEWSFEPYRVRSFPIRLPDPSDTAASHTQTAAASVAPAYHNPSISPYTTRFYPNPGYGVPSGYHAAAAPVQYVSYLTPSRPGIGQGDLRLTTYAVSWAAARGNGRRAILADEWLLLFSPNVAAVMRTDLPLAARQLSCQGTIVGTSGRAVCLYAGNALQFLDITSGATQNIALGELMAHSGDTASPPPPVPTQAVVDGAVVYVTGPAGVMAVNAATAQQAFLTPWPEGALAAKPKVDPNTAAQPGYTPGSTARYVPGYTGYMPAPGTVVFGNPYQVNVAQVFVSPTISRVRDGVLYTLTSASRVVALEQKGSDER